MSVMNTCQFCFVFGNTTALCMEAETCGIKNCYLPFKHKHNVCNRCITTCYKDAPSSMINDKNSNTKNNNDYKNFKKNKSRSQK